jgi:hypothetical protein
MLEDNENSGRSELVDVNWNVDQLPSNSRYNVTHITIYNLNGFHLQIPLKLSVSIALMRISNLMETCFVGLQLQSQATHAASRIWENR